MKRKLKFPNKWQLLIAKVTKKYIQTFFDAVFFVFIHWGQSSSTAVNSLFFKHAIEIECIVHNLLVIG